MKVGDLVKFEPNENDFVINDMVDRRRLGTVLGFDVYRGTEGRRPLHKSEPIIEVLWSTGAPGWILQSRVEVVNECR